MTLGTLVTAEGRNIGRDGKPLPFILPKRFNKHYLDYIAEGKHEKAKDIAEIAADTQVFHERHPGTRILSGKYFAELVTTRIPEVIAKGGNAALIKYDLDNLKAFNAKYGEIATDKILEAGANHASTKIRDQDYFARSNDKGDEFLFWVESYEKGIDEDNRERSLIEEDVRNIEGRVRTAFLNKMRETQDQGLVTIKDGTSQHLIPSMTGAFVLLKEFHDKEPTYNQLATEAESQLLLGKDQKKGFLYKL